MKRLNQNLHEHDLTGKFLPWRLDIDQPVLLRIENTLFLPVYSTEEKLRSSMVIARQTRYKIKHIDDGRDFFDSVKGKIRVCLDPWITPEGNTRFQELFAPEDSN